MLVRILPCVALFLLSAANLFSNGILINDASKGNYLTLKKSEYVVNVENQAAIVTVTNEFINTDSIVHSPKYAFPMPSEASSVRLRWYIHGLWKDAIIISEPQDSTLPGLNENNSIDENLLKYFGKTPLFFNLNEDIYPGQSITVELSYVQLLKYELYHVSFEGINDYRPIQQEPLDLQKLSFTVNSGRIIEELKCISHQDADIEFDEHISKIFCQYQNQPAAKDYEIVYRLKSDDFGLFGFSTYMDNTPDSKERGFFLFIVEPDASDNTQTLDKLFTLVIDISGSMSGEKIIQAKEAAKFIIDRINSNDKFNLIAFNSIITNFKYSLVDYNLANKTEAVDFIANIKAGGSTNINDALLRAISQFDGYNDTKDKIIIFFTDGRPTSGVTNTPDILANIRNANKGKNVKIHCFGIGSNVNKQLLTLLASENGGVCDFVLDKMLADIISNFYLKVKNPVVLNPAITYEPDIVTELYPKRLENLYKGQQFLVAGRYDTPIDNLKISLTGNANNRDVKFDYGLNLADVDIPERSFLPKIWAKMKIEHLVVEYYANLNDTSKANAIKEEIINLSIMFRVVSIFTSYGALGDNLNERGDDYGTGNFDNCLKIYTTDRNHDFYSLPNPFLNETKFKIYIHDDFTEQIPLKIYDLNGRLVKILYLNIKGPGLYEIEWNGGTDDGSRVMPGTYICFVEFNNKILVYKIIKK